MSVINQFLVFSDQKYPKSDEYRYFTPKYTVGFIRFEDYETFRDFVEANPANPMRYTRANRPLLCGEYATTVITSHMERSRIGDVTRRRGERGVFLTKRLT